MYDKKGTAFEEFVGLGIFIFAILIGLLFLFGCRVYKDTQEYEAFEFSKDEIEATKALNFFLEMHHPDDPEKKILDLIVESDLDDTDDFMYLNLKTFEYLEQLHLLKNPDMSWRLDIDGRFVTGGALNINAGGVRKAEIIIPSIDENLELREKTVTLYIKRTPQMI